jgi:hypothetical protein
VVQFSDILESAKGLGEFSPELLTKMIEIFGTIAAKQE